MFESVMASLAVAQLGTLSWVWGHFAPASRLRSPFVCCLLTLQGQHTTQFPFRIRNTGVPQG